jgi:hypothetical protein
MLAVLPTLEMAKRTSRGRIDPLIEDSPALREKVNPARSRDAGNSMLSKELPGGNRRFPAEFDCDTYKWRHLIENFFGKLKEYRGADNKMLQDRHQFERIYLPRINRHPAPVNVNTP